VSAIYISDEESIVKPFGVKNVARSRFPVVIVVLSAMLSDNFPEIVIH
jgi:hypothetical protein